MKAKELREKTVEELKAELDTLIKQELTLKLVNKSGQLAKSHLINQTRRDIAKIKTVLTEKAGE